MMRRFYLLAICLSFAGEIFADEIAPKDAGKTNIVSNVATIKQWSRQYVFIDADGKLHDPSGQLVKFADEVGRQNRADNVLQVVEAAHAGMTNAMQRIYNMTNNVPTRGISLRFTMKPETERANFYAYIVNQTSDGNVDTATYYFSHRLDIPPKMQRRYRNGEKTVFIEGEWVDYKPDGFTATDAQGVLWDGCNRIRFTRPDWAKGYPSRPNKHCTIGHPVSGLDFAGGMVFVDGLPTFTGYYTNGTERIYFDNGAYKGKESIE